jgi:hypothetical protein
MSLISFKGVRAKLEPLYFNKAFIFPFFCGGNPIMMIFAHLKLPSLLYRHDDRETTPFQINALLVA